MQIKATHWHASFSFVMKMCSGICLFVEYSHHLRSPSPSDKETSLPGKILETERKRERAVGLVSE
uniref:Uncharacterized protein n=1 Tax=Rhizophora mucronata TaxID=61149 RepID=A0A2P2QTY3_RHIMU